MKRIREASPERSVARTLVEPAPELSITKDSQPVVTSRSQLERLPPDLQQNIFEMLRPRAVLRLGRTCTTLWKVADSVVLKPRPEYTTHKSVPFGGNEVDDSGWKWPRYDVDQLNLSRIWRHFSERFDMAGRPVYDSMSREDFKMYKEILIPRAARLFPLLRLSSTQLVGCLKALLEADQDTRTELRIDLVDDQALRSLKDISDSYVAASEKIAAIALCFQFDQKVFPFDVTGLGTLLKSLSLYHLDQLHALRGDLNAIRRCALDYAFLNKAGAAQAVRQRMPHMQELAINSFTPQVSSLLDAMPGIHTVSLSDRIVRDEDGVSANGLIRSGVLHLHLDAVEMTTQHLGGLHASPGLAKLESLHLVDCKVADVEKLKALLKDMSALKALQLIDVRIPRNVDPDVRLGLEEQFTQLLEELAVRPGLSLEVRQTEDPRLS